MNLTNKRKKYLKRKWGNKHNDYNALYAPNKYLFKMQAKKEKEAIAKLEKNLDTLGYHVVVDVSAAYYGYYPDSEEKPSIGEFMALRSGYEVSHFIQRQHRHYDFRYNLSEEDSKGYVLTGQSTQYGKRYARYSFETYFLVSHSHWYGSLNSKRVYWSGDYQELRSDYTWSSIPKHSRHMACIQVAIQKYEDKSNEDEYNYHDVTLHFFNEDEVLIDSLTDVIFLNDGQSTENYFIDQAKQNLIPELFQEIWETEFKMPAFTVFNNIVLQTQERNAITLTEALFFYHAWLRDEKEILAIAHDILTVHADKGKNSNYLETTEHAEIEALVKGIDCIACKGCGCDDCDYGTVYEESNPDSMQYWGELIYTVSGMITEVYNIDDYTCRYYEGDWGMFPNWEGN